MFLKRLVYWVGFLFILVSIFVAGILFVRSYPELQFQVEVMTGLTMPEIIVEQPTGLKVVGFSMLAACGICALGSYLVMAMELKRLRKKTAKQ